MQREFASTYESTIRQIKELKNNNDSLNRIIGVESSQSIATKIKKEETSMEEIIQKVERLIQKMQQSYLDPDTARKIGTAKQQFRIQKDRRKQLLHSSNYEQELHIVQRPYQGTPEGRQQVRTFQSSLAYDPSWKEQNQKETESTSRSGSYGVMALRHEQEVDVDLEMERKLMQERTKDINIVSNNLLNVQGILQQTSQMAFQQGQQLDIIGDDMFETYKNLKGARENLNEANEHHRRSKRKYIVLSVLVLLGLAIGIAIMVL